MSYLHSRCPARPFEKTMVTWEENTSCCCWILVEKFSRGLSKRYSTCPEEQFEAKPIFLDEDNLQFYHQFTTLSDRYKWLFAKRVSTGLSEMLSTSPEKYFVKNNLFNIYNYENCFMTWAKIFCQGLQNCLLRVQSKVLLKNLLFPKPHTLSSSHFKRNVFGSFTNKSVGVVQLVFFASSGTSWGKSSSVEKVYRFSSFSDSEQKTHSSCVEAVF